jgi:arginine/lysine/histidine transporter system substrate-binding protein
LTNNQFALNKLSRRTYAIGAAVVLIIAVVAVLTAIFGGSEDRALERIQDSGVLRVGMDASYPPFESLDADHQVVGFDVDVAIELGKRLGVEVEFVNIAYDGLYDALLTEQVDILISGLVAAPEFQGKANFSVPYFNMGEYLVVRRDSSLRGMEDTSGLTLAVEIGSGGDVEARKWQRRLGDLEVVRQPDSGAALNAVLNGEADGAIVDGVTARLAIGQHAELILAENVVETLIAAGVHPESGALLGQVDDAMGSMLDDGTITRLIDKWFGPQQGQ